MLVLKVRIDLFFVVFGAVALEVLLYAVLISYICERFGMSKNEYTNGRRLLAQVSSGIESE